MPVMNSAIMMMKIASGSMPARSQSEFLSKVILVPLLLRQRPGRAPAGARQRIKM